MSERDATKIRTSLSFIVVILNYRGITVFSIFSYLFFLFRLVIVVTWVARNRKFAQTIVSDACKLNKMSDLENEASSVFSRGLRRCL